MHWGYWWPRDLWIITGAGPHENSLIDLCSSNLLWWEAVQNIQADSRTTQWRNCCLVTHHTRGYWNLKTLSRALLAVSDKKVITEWQEESMAWLKLDWNSWYRSMLLIYRHSWIWRHSKIPLFLQFCSLLYLCWSLTFWNYNISGIEMTIFVISGGLLFLAIYSTIALIMHETVHGLRKVWKDR